MKKSLTPPLTFASTDPGDVSPEVKARMAQVVLANSDSSFQPLITVTSYTSAMVESPLLTATLLANCDCNLLSPTARPSGN